MKWLIIFLLAIFTVSLNAQTVSGIASQTEYDVYRQIIRNWFITENTKSLVIIKSTETNAGSQLDVSAEYLYKNFGKIPREMIEDFTSKNQDSSKLEDRFDLRPRVFLVTHDELRPIWNLDYSHGSKAYEKAFLEKYSTVGFLTFSRVGFDETKTKALLEVGSVYAPLGGHGSYVYLKKKSSGWKIVKKVRSWIS